MTENSCKGCLEYSDTKICKFIPQKYKTQCPCTTCIVKVTCNEQCDKLYDFEKSLVY